jgi:glycosyltransferase involved in cell wall biosynthesis
MATAKPVLDLAVIHLTIEGIAAGGGGVCTVTRGHLAALPRVRKALAAEGIKLTPYMVETHFGPDYHHFDRTYLEKTRSELHAMGGEFFTVLNRSPNGLPVSCNWPGGEDFFGTMEQIRLESAAAASIARSVARNHDATVVYCHDTFFIMSPVYGTMQDNDESVQWLRVVHSTTLKHDKEPVDPDKIGAEFASFYWAKRFPNVHIGTISGFISDHLVKDYAADPATIVPTGNGVDPLDAKFRVRSERDVLKTIKKYNDKLAADGRERYQVPLDKKLVLSFGRPVPYKRLDLTLEAMKHLPDEYHPAIVTLGPYPDLEKHADALGRPATVINAFDYDLCACLSQYDKTVAVPILAYNEPFGLIPPELRLLVRHSGGLLVVPSDGGGLAEQVTDGVDGFVVKEPAKDIKRLAKCIQDIDQLGPRDKRRIRENGLKLVFTGGYTWSGRILETLGAVNADVRRVAKKVLKVVAAEERAAIA